MPGYRTAKRIAIAVVGGTLLLIGALMLVLPGPGVLVVAAGLGVLAVEFAWARRLLKRAKEQTSAIAGGARPNPERRERP